MTKFNIKEWTVEIEAWIIKLGSMPKKVIISKDISRSYEMAKATIFELENGKYALVTENGCSCYEQSDAEIELFKDLDKAKTQFEKFIQEDSS